MSSPAAARAVANEVNLQVTLALLKPTVTSYAPDVSEVLKTIKRSPLQIVRTRRLFWKVEDEAKKFYAEHEGRFFHQRLLLMASASRFGLGDTRNGFHGSDSPESAARELSMVFDGWDVNWWLEQERQRYADELKSTAS
ncbi:hypothetical protein OC845_001985 [Tilletia horrida]|nr:hypothetical protein OC845_001985 [Tilletia horrida]